jgi:hypothetical protein
MKWFFFIFVCVLFSSCSRAALIQPIETSTPSVEVKVTNPPPQSPEPTPEDPEEEKSPIIELPLVPKLTSNGEKLIIEFEVDRPYKNSYPEAPDARASGITVGIGYDCHYNSSSVIKQDWKGLGETNSTRLANTHPYFGQSAKDHLHEIIDILIKWNIAYKVFTEVDVAREYDNCKRTFPGFESLRPNAQAALISLTFNRGTGMVGPSRLEMRNIRDLITKQYYKAIAN